MITGTAPKVFSEPKLHHLTRSHHETISPTDQQMHVQDFPWILYVLSQLQWHIIPSSPFSSSQDSQNFTTHFCITSRFHLTPLTMKIFTEPFFSIDNTITLVSIANYTHCPVSVPHSDSVS